MVSNELVYESPTKRLYFLVMLEILIPLIMYNNNNKTLNKDITMTISTICSVKKLNINSIISPFSNYNYVLFHVFYYNTEIPAYKLIFD